MITTLLATTLTIWLMVLSIRVISLRGKTGTSLGAGDVPALERRIRAQGNLTEYAPMFVILIGLAEIQDGSQIVLGGISILFLAARLSHGYALSFSENSPAARLFGMATTFTMMGLAALYCLYVALT